MPPPAAAPEKLDMGQCLLEKLREKIVQRAGKNSIASIGRRFRIMDRGGGVGEGKGDNQLNAWELHQGLCQVGIDVDRPGCILLLKAIDKNGNGQVSFDEFIQALRGKIGPARMALIDQAFQCLQPVNGIVTRDTMAKMYDPSKNPDVIEGRKTAEEALIEFMSMFDANGDGTITLDEFRDYYKNVSSSIDDDQYFELMIRNAWHMSGGEGAAQNTTCLRVLVTFKNGDKEVVEVKNDLGLDPTDVRAIKARLYSQGVTQIQKISTGFAGEF